MQDNIINTMHWGKLSLPFMVRAEPGHIKKIIDGDFEHYVFEDPILDFICDPNNIISVGDHVAGQKGVYEVLEIIEQRDSKGEFTFLDFQPIWIRTKAKFFDLVRQKKPTIN